MEDKITRKSGYNIRSIDDIFKYGEKFYMDIIDENGGLPEFITEAYEGFEHFPRNLSFKIPNITRIWNLPFNSGGFMYGSTMGHVHAQYDFDAQEVYEFCDYGGMLIANEEGIKLYACKPKDKVIVSPACMMTIINLSFKKLETLDMANPLTNGSSKELVKKKGPMIALYHLSGSVDKYHDLYLSSRFDKKISFPTDGKVIMKLNKNYEKFRIRDDISIEFDIADNESSLLESILSNREEFARYNIQVIEGKRAVECIGRDGRLYCLDGLLGDIARQEAKMIHKMLGMV